MGGEQAVAGAQDLLAAVGGQGAGRGATAGAPRGRIQPDRTPVAALCVRENRCESILHRVLLGQGERGAQR